MSKKSKEIIDKITNYAMEMSLGKGYLNKLKGFDLILRSPSCLPTIPELEEEANKEYKKLLKSADYASATFECYRNIKAGSEDKYFFDVITKELNKKQNYSKNFAWLIEKIYKSVPHEGYVE